MSAIYIILSLILFVIVIIQIGKITELASSLKGEYAQERSSNNFNAPFFLFIVLLMLVVTSWSAYYFKNYMLGFGPHIPASAHGSSLDKIFKTTLFVTGIVFIITHVLLAWYAFKYKGVRGRKALFMPHDNRLEIIWTALPAIVMTYLVIGGLDSWNKVMADVSSKDQYIEIEATGMQFAWIIRYPGADNKLGTKNYKLITGDNDLGQDWKDPKNLDDFKPDEIVLPVNKKVRVRITSRDVLHSFSLAHFRLKMDAVPGMPTYFVFTPTVTTEEYRQSLRKYPEYNIPADPADPEGPRLWEKFDYELGCSELCGNGHFSMRRVVRIVSQEEYDKWVSTQKSYYQSTIKGTASDPFASSAKPAGELSEADIKARAAEIEAQMSAIAEGKVKDDKEMVLTLKNVNFETGSAKLTEISHFELDNLSDAMVKYPKLTVEVAGHTDNVGDKKSNLTLSQQRSDVVKTYLVKKGIDAKRLTSKGYGDTSPLAPNDTEDNKAKNRRTEFKIITY
ncbi:MAG: OmpA family protein [Saprospiraceae bacterium]|nr:OmpA family protein [Saprospiraceae bacterium]